MKRILVFGCMLAAMAGFTACTDDNTGDGGYEGINYIYLSTQEGKTTLYETDSDPLVVEVMLTAAPLKSDYSVSIAARARAASILVQKFSSPITLSSSAFLITASG